MGAILWTSLRRARYAGTSIALSTPIRDLQQERINAALQRISKKVTQAMNSKLCVPIELDELERAMKAMACEKAPGPDGVIIEFFKTLWHLVGPDYLSMIKRTLVDGNLPSSIV